MQAVSSRRPVDGTVAEFTVFYPLLKPEAKDALQRRPQERRAAESDCLESRCGACAAR